MAEEDTTKWITCARCGHANRRHRILYEKTVLALEDDDPVNEHHSSSECMGCESIKYVVSRSDWTGDDLPWKAQETDFKVYPDAPGSNQERLPAINQQVWATDNEEGFLIPVPVWKMYKETIDALNAKIRTLAGGGLRATVEAICLDNQITRGTLENKIDELAERKLLTTGQAQLLHEALYR